MDSPNSKEDLLEGFMKYLRFERQYSEHTLRSYRKDIEQFYLFNTTRLGNLGITEVHSSHLRSWLVDMMKSDYSSKSVNRKLSAVKSFYKYLKRNAHLKNNPAGMIQGPKLSKRLPSIIRQEDVRQGLELELPEDNFSALRDQIMINLFYQTGMRRAELIQLKEESIDHNRKTVKVLGKGNKERLIPISAELSQMLLSFSEAKKDLFGETEYLIVTDKGKKMYPKFVYNKVRAWVSRVSTADKRSPHILRHSFATHLADEGAELNAIKELLGHASLAATEVYTHNSIERLKNVYGASHPRATKKR